MPFSRPSWSRPNWQSPSFQAPFAPSEGAHGYSTGDRIYIEGVTGGTPSINGDCLRDLSNTSGIYLVSDPPVVTVTLVSSIYR